jgi:hypothetical protein
LHRARRQLDLGDGNDLLYHSKKDQQVEMFVLKGNILYKKHGGLQIENGVVSITDQLKVLLSTISWKIMNDALELFT